MNAAEKKTSNWTQWVSLLITIITLTVGSVVWAFNREDSIYSFVTTGDKTVEKEIRENVQELYVKKNEFAKIEQCMIDTKQKIDKMEDKIDKLIELSIKRKDK